MVPPHTQPFLLEDMVVSFFHIKPRTLALYNSQFDVVEAIVVLMVQSIGFGCGLGDTGSTI